MKKLAIAFLLISFTLTSCYAMEPVKLEKPTIENGNSLMKCLTERHSVRSFKADDISNKHLSYLLWCANGINREDGKRTAPSAMNRQPIKLYVVDKNRTYLYDHAEHSLIPISEGDFRQPVRGNMPAMNILVVADDGSDGAAGVNAGYVSQNIYLAATDLGLGTVACGTMDAEAFAKVCHLTPQQKIIVQHPTGWPAQ